MDIVVLNDLKGPSLTSSLFFQERKFLADSPPIEARQHDGGLLHALRSLVGFPDVQGGEVEDRGLFRYGPGVRKHRPGVGLELDLVGETERLEQLHPLLE